MIETKSPRIECLIPHIDATSGSMRRTTDAARNMPNLRDLSMNFTRRSLLTALYGLAVRPALAQQQPSLFEAYERETGGRIGLYAENLATGTRINWRADERFVMCSTFKASLAACVLS